MDSFALMLVAAALFLLIASFALKPSNILKIPHSVFLVLVGIVLAFIIREIPALSFLGQFHLSPELIFFVFLPTLLFESSFKFPLRKLNADKIPIILLSIFGYLLSVAFITGLFILVGLFIPIPLPFFAILLFAAIISATDPVAVLSVFKKLGVTPRLTHLFEGESLFNDGTSYAFFVILIAFFVHDGGNLELLHLDIAILQFIVMFIGGIVFGIGMGYLFTWMISLVKDEETIQLTLSLVMAHLTFLLADLSKHLLHFGDYEFEVSAIIATVMASVILGSRGIQKFNPEVRIHMDVLWEHFAFIANSLIFILIGMLTVDSMTLENMKLLGVTIVISFIIIMISRIFSIYIPLLGFNLFAKKYRKIPSQWMKILSWGSLRGAIAIAALLMIPDDLTIPNWTLEISLKETMTTLIISCVLFTTFIKAMMLEYFVEKMQLAKFSNIETLETLEGKILTIYTLIEKIEELRSKDYLSDKNAKRLIREYKNSKKHSIRKLSCFFSKDCSTSQIAGFLHLHALIIEKKILQNLLDHHEIDEDTYWALNDKLVRQEERLRTGEKQIQGAPIDLKKLEGKDIPLRYQMTRARAIILRKVLRRLNEFTEAGLCIPKKELSLVINQYKKWADKAEEGRLYILKKYPKISRQGEYKIFSQYTKDLEHSLIKGLEQKSILNNRVSLFLQKEGLR